MSMYIRPHLKSLWLKEELFVISDFILSVTFRTTVLCKILNDKSCTVFHFSVLCVWQEPFHLLTHPVLMPFQHVALMVKAFVTTTEDGLRPTA